MIDLKGDNCNTTSFRCATQQNPGLTKAPYFIIPQVLHENMASMNTLLRWKRIPALMILSCLFIGCSGYDGKLSDSSTVYLAGNGPSAGRNSQPGARAYWDGDNVSGSPSMVLNLTRQTLYYYKGGQLVGVSPVSTGKEGYDTPSGDFRVIQKDRDHVSTLYGDFVDATGTVVTPNVSANDPKPPGTSFRGSPMPFFMRLHGGIGMHGGFLPGVPDSHGCIRLPAKMAEIFFANTPVGTPVKITH